MSELDRILNGGPKLVPKPEPAAEPDDLELPALGSPYQAHARASNKPVYSLHCLRGAKGCTSFQFVQIDSHSEFRAEKDGQIIKLRFVGSKIWEVVIGGLNLWRLYDLIHRHQVSWVMEADRPFPTGKDGEAFISSIQIKEIEREA